jgi:hypothetical protein
MAIETYGGAVYETKLTLKIGWVLGNTRGIWDAASCSKQLHKVITTMPQQFASYTPAIWLGRCP